MFILRAIKGIFFWIFFGILLFFAANYKVNGRPLYKVAQGFFSSEGFKEGTKDLKMFFGGFLKTVGEQIQEDVTEKDKKQLEKVIQDQLKVKENKK